MARMHSRRKGKSGSKRPLEQGKSTWQRYTKKEIEMLVVKLIKEDQSPAHIGLVLRDSYGIPNIRELLGKRLEQFAKEKTLLPALPQDLAALIKRAALIEKHLELNKQDVTSRRGLMLTRSKIHRLAKYHKRAGRIAENWAYSSESGKLLV